MSQNYESPPPPVDISVGALVHNIVYTCFILLSTVSGVGKVGKSYTFAPWNKIK